MNIKEDVLFNIEWYYDHYIKQPYRTFETGIKNLWLWKRIIWNDRWWDYSFLDTIILFKLKDMSKHWVKDTHYINDECDKKIIDKLISLLEEIQELEDECTIKADRKINEKYQEFGRLLYDIKEMPIYDNEGKEIDKKNECSTIRTLWD